MNPEGGGSDLQPAAVQQLSGQTVQRCEVEIPKENRPFVATDERAMPNWMSKLHTAGRSYPPVFFGRYLPSPLLIA